MYLTENTNSETPATIDYKNHLFACYLYCTTEFLGQKVIQYCSAKVVHQFTDTYPGKTVLEDFYLSKNQVN